MRGETATWPAFKEIIILETSVFLFGLLVDKHAGLLKAEEEPDEEFRQEIGTRHNSPGVPYLQCIICHFAAVYWNMPVQVFFTFLSYFLISIIFSCSFIYILLFLSYWLSSLVPFVFVSFIIFYHCLFLPRSLSSVFCRLFFPYFVFFFFCCFFHCRCFRLSPVLVLLCHVNLREYITENTHS